MGFFSAGKQTSTTKQSMPKWQEDAVKQNLSGAMSSPDVTFTDRNLTAGNNAAMYQGLNQVQGLDPGITGQQYGGFMGAGFDSMMNPESMRAQFDQNAANAVMSNQNLQPGMDALQAGYDKTLAQGLVGAGYGAGGFTGNFGSAGALAKGAAIGNAQGQYLGGVADLYGRAQDQAIGAGIGYGSQYSQLQQGNAQNLINGSLNGIGQQATLGGQIFGMGGTMTGLDQAGIDREVNRDMFNAAAPRETLAFRQGQAGTMGQYGGTTKTTTPTASPFQQALGAGVALGGAYLTGGGSLAGGGMGSIFGGGGGAAAGGGMASIGLPNYKYLT